MGTSQGVMRGMGRQFELMLYNFAGFWAAGFSLGYLLTFRYDLGLPGLWFGIMVGLNTTAALNINSLLATDWKAEADKAASARNEALDVAAAITEFDLDEMESDGDRLLQGEGDCGGGVPYSPTVEGSSSLRIDRTTTSTLQDNLMVDTLSPNSQAIEPPAQNGFHAVSLI